MFQKRKRFYEKARVQEEKKQYVIYLDARILSTPKRNVFYLPTLALAQGVCDEWNGQGDMMDMGKMPQTCLAFTAIDQIKHHDRAVKDHLLNFLFTDTLCYRVEQNHQLYAHQCEQWDGVLEQLKDHHGICLPVTSRLSGINIDQDVLDFFHQFIEKQDLFSLIVLERFITLTGSFILGFCFMSGYFDAQKAFDLAHLERKFFQGQWGKDQEEIEKEAGIKKELIEAEIFFKYLKNNERKT